MAKVTTNIIQHSEQYFSAISASIAMAKSGCDSALRAAQLGESVGLMSTPGLESSLDSMLQIATETFAQSEDIEGNFGRVCAGFVQVIQ